jgi:serine/threonine protein kinase
VPAKANPNNPKAETIVQLIVMEYIEKSVNDIMTANMQLYSKNSTFEPSKNEKAKFVPMTPQAITRIMKDLITSLFLMHLNGIYHMDIKPQNTMYH